MKQKYSLSGHYRKAIVTGGVAAIFVRRALNGQKNGLNSILINVFIFTYL